MESLGIDPKLLIAQVINFSLFLFIFYKFISKPFIKFLDNEKKKDEDIRKAHEKALKQTADLEKKENELKQLLKQERDKVIDKAKKDAEVVKQQILEEARDQGEKIKQKALKQVELEKENIYRDAREKVNELSFYLVNNALKDVLTDELRKKITQQILRNSPKELDLNET